MGLEPQQKTILEYLDKQTGYKDQKDMAKELKIKASSLTTGLSKLKVAGLADRENEDSTSWAITDEGHDVVTGGGAKISREDLGLNESQIFAAHGHSIGGITTEKLTLITETVFNDDPYDMDKVWSYLAQLNVPIDIRRAWVTTWQSYLSKGGKPASISDALKVQITPPEKRTEEQVKEAQKQERDWDIEENTQSGIPEVVRIGPGLGPYTFQEASQIVSLKIRAIKGLVGYNPPQQTEQLSNLITALAPFLKQDTDQSLLKEIVLQRMGDMTKAITESMPKQGAQPNALEQFTGVLATLEKLGPILRPLLGLPEPAANSPQNKTAIQLQNRDGTPVVMDIDNFITLEKFKAEQKREEQSAQGREEFMQTVRGFVDRLGKAAERAVQQ